MGHPLQKFQSSITEIGVSKLGSSHREGRVGCAEDLKGAHPNLETILVVLEEVCELLGRRHPVVVEGAVPGREVLEGKLVRLEGLLILVDIARPEESLEAGHVLSQHAQLWQDWALEEDDVPGLEGLFPSLAPALHKGKQVGKVQDDQI